MKYYLDAQAFLNRHGAKSIVFCRFMPIFRTPFVAGIAKMPFLRFFTYNVIGGICWILIMLYAGYFLGQIPWFKTHFDLAVLLIIGVSLLPAIWTAVKSRLQPMRYKKPQRNRSLTGAREEK